MVAKQPIGRRATGTWEATAMFFPWNMTQLWTDHIDEARGFALLSRMDDRQIGIRWHCGSRAAGDAS
jgi:hypothetical protein